MNQEIEKLKKDRQEIIQNVQILETQRNQLITRMAEIQGIIKYLQEKEIKNNKKEVK